MELEVGELRGKTLLGHCGLAEKCHGHVLSDLIEASCIEATQDEEDVVPMMDFVDDGLPAHIPELIGAPPGVEDGRRGWRGSGPPRMASFMGKDRPFAE